MTKIVTRILPLALLLILAGIFLFFTVGDPYQRSASSIKEACAESASFEQCYGKAFKEYAREHGPVDAFRTLLALQQVDRRAVGCHLIAHNIGYGTFERSPGTWQEDFRNVSQECSYGAMHGILERAIGTFPDGLTKEMVPTICGDNPRGDCNHIVGHLSLIQSDHSVPGALDLCSALTEPAQYNYCASGVFMEEETAVNLINHGFVDESWLDWRARAPGLKELCRAQTGSDQVMCWKELAHIFAGIEEDDAGAFRECSVGPSTEASYECLSHAVGILATQKQFNAPDMRRMCDAYAAFGNIDGCHALVTGAHLSTQPQETEDAAAYCAALTDSSSARSCFAMLGSMLRSNTIYEESDRRGVCLLAPDDFRNACLEGGTIPALLYENHPEQI